MITDTQAYPCFNPAGMNTTTGMPTSNVRHDIDPDLVAAQVEHKIASHETWRANLKELARTALASYKKVIEQPGGRWSGRVPEGDDYVDPLIDEWIAREREHYAHVRIIELPQEGRRFLLVYGEADDAIVTTGTGPFKGLDEARNWFLDGGR